MPIWSLLALVGVGVAALAGRAVFRRTQQGTAASAAGLSPVADLTHLPHALQRTALWALCDGGFERRVVHGVLTRASHDIDVTAFDLETAREHRGEWAYLPVDQPFRIGGVVSIVACEIDRRFPHLLLKRAGVGDELQDDNAIDRMGHVAKVVRTSFGVPLSIAAELPATLPAARLSSDVPEQWRAYGDATVLAELLAGGFGRALVEAGRRDLVVELLDGLVVVYPAAREVVGADAFADLTATALTIVEALLVSTRPLSPRGVEVKRGPSS